ncbi:MAG TPA: aminoglycoside phosphotransferase family protein [Microlunatus sp.]
MIRVTDLQLDRRTAATILGMRAESLQSVDLLRTHNHTWQVTADDASYFVKAHTKDWYDSRPASSIPVRHELTGHRILRAAGLAGPMVIAYSTDTDNPLGWPYLVTRQLPGAPLVDLLSTLPAEPDDRVLTSVGRYLASMHRLTYDQPGYLIGGPPAAPDPAQWIHWLSRPERFLLYFFETLTADAANVGVATRDAAAGLLERTLPRLRSAYEPLRFVHGDCHANVFYLDQVQADWRVSGVLDMENCSAGSPPFDFAKLFIELAGRIAARHAWWQPLFRGYGHQPDFDLIRVLLVGHAHINYSCLGRSLWPANREDLINHILAARTWSELFDLERDRSGDPLR